MIPYIHQYQKEMGVCSMSNFDSVLQRRQTRSLKWDMMEKVYNLEDASDILPMWVADMDFMAPQPVLDAIQEQLKHGILGYSYVCEGCKKAIISWFETRHHWTIDSSTILFHLGVIPIIATVIETFTKENDQIGMMTPVYPPFFNLPTNQHRRITQVTLIEQEGIYSIDFEQLGRTFKDGVKLFILCNPHNPGGIVWTGDDLQRIVDLAIQYDVLILSDEIHADLIMKGHQYTPLLTLPNASDAKIITAIAPTKTFNLAGIQAAMMVVPNDELRARLELNATAHGHTNLNVFASVAVQAAYTYGVAWLDELLQYIERNMDYCIDELNVIPGIHVRKPEGTYLMWIDYRATKLTEEEMMNRLLHKGKVALEPGTKYGEAGRGFLRINIACPFEMLQDGIERFKKALQQ